VSRTRVCIVNPFQHGGGAEFQISLLTAALQAANRFDVWYLTHHVAPEIQPNGYEIVRIGDDDRVPRLGYVTDFVPLYRALRSLKPHVIYQRVACGYTGICAFYTRQHHRLTRMIWHVAHTTDVSRESLDTGRNILRRRFEKCSVEYGIRRTDRIVVQTNDQDRLLTQNYGRQADAVIPNFHPDAPEQLDKTGPLTVVWVANLKLWKRPDVFVRLAQALRDLPGVRFLMLGEAPPADSKWAIELMQSIETTPNLEFLGYRSAADVNQFLARASIFVNTSVHEGFPNTFVQAWLRDAVVVSLSVNPDRVLDARGVGIHAQTEEGLQKSVRHLLTDPAARAAYAERARAYAQSTHSVRNIGKLTEMIDECAAAA
jgi:glycosyltransferase involved in cell wall biosynthesis